MNYKIVEKKNHLAVHAICSSLASAQKYISETIPVHVAKRYFMDKTLTAESFEIVDEKGNLVNPQTPKTP